MKIELTSLAKTELSNLVKIQNVLEQSESDIDLYFGFSSYDQLLFDMQMLEDGDYVENDGIYQVWDPTHSCHQKAITLEKFKEMDIDIVISSIADHDISFAKLIADFKPKKPSATCYLS